MGDTPCATERGDEEAMTGPVIAAPAALSDGTVTLCLGCAARARVLTNEQLATLEQEKERLDG